MTCAWRVREFREKNSQPCRQEGVCIDYLLQSNKSLQYSVISNKHKLDLPLLCGDRSLLLA